jgi:hypothetical protein
MNKHYAINLKTYETKAYVSSNLAKTMNTGCVTFTNADELLADRNMTGPRIVEVFNKISDKPVKKFSDNKTGAKRLFKLVEDTPITKTYWDSGEYNSKGVDNTSPKEVKAKAVKKSIFNGKWIRTLVISNPRRLNKKEVCGYASFQILLKHGADMPYELYLESGGRKEDLLWDIKKGWVELTNG